MEFEAEEGFANGFYTEDFFKCGYHKNGYVDYVGDEPGHKRTAARVVRFMERHVRGGKILDVGCAAGYFLECLGPNWDPYGCEPCEAMAEIARRKFGERISRQAFEDYRSEISFDVITLWDSLEHMIDPPACIRKVHSLLDDHGSLFIRTPDAGSTAARILGRSWYHYGPPGHLHFFDRRTIAILLGRCGLRVERITFLPRYVSLSEISVTLGSMTGLRWLKRLSERLAANSNWNRSIPHQVFDEMVVMARKDGCSEGR